MPGLPACPDLPALQREVLRRWRSRPAPARAADGRPRWICYAEPTVAAGVPGLHHVADWVLADVLPRFRIMQGYDVPRRAGWDCHGLPGEVAVERELGLRGAADIEAYGTGAFVARCRESAARHAAALARLAEQAGCGAGLAAAWTTMDPAYVESVWRSLRVLFDRGLLTSDLQISPGCPRCGTPLSDREAARPEAQRAVSEAVVTVRFPLLGALPAMLQGASLLAVTAQPWTLAANAAVAVHPEATYAVARRSGQGDRVVVADAVLGRVLGEGWHVTGRLPGRELAGLAYDPPVPVAALGPHLVVATPLAFGADAGGAGLGGAGTGLAGTGLAGRDGTGLVGVAPPFGAADLAVARSCGLPVPDLVGPDGTFAARVPLVGGLTIAAASQRLIGDLADRGLLHASRWREQSRPHCWRCASALFPRAVRAWRIPDDGAGWAVSRSRYWGTPLPIWTCPAGHLTCAGSLAELSALASRDLTGLDPHRPTVDDIVFACPRCGAPARRVPDVLDAAYDTAAMPFAPRPNAAGLTDDYPAQLACAAGDQASGWLDTLRHLGTLITGRPPYQQAVRPGPVADGQGRAVRGHLGNIQEPLAVLDTHGADAVRWLFAATRSPDTAGPVLRDITRTVLLPYWSAAHLLSASRPARAAGPAAAGSAAAGRAAAGRAAGRPTLDRWLLSELHILIREVTAALEAADTVAACRLLAGFIDDLSGWYLRRARRRIAAFPAEPDGASGLATLDECVQTLTRLLAPFVPFITDYVWTALHPSPDSVHLAAWPAADLTQIDPVLAGQVAQARRLAALGQAARSAAGVPDGQPLSRALASADTVAQLPPDLRADVCAELDVTALEPAADLPAPGPGWAVASAAGETIALEIPLTPAPCWLSPADSAAPS